MKKQDVRLPEILDTGAFERLHLILSEIDDSKGAVSLNAEHVERITTPCAQLIMAYLMEHKGGRKKSSSKIIDASPAMISAWSDLGLAEQFPLEAA